MTKQRGFTLVEMLVIAPLVILLVGAFIAAIVSLTGEVVASRTANQLAFSVQDALDRIEQDVEVSSGFLTTNAIAPVSPQGVDAGTTKFVNEGSANGQALILTLRGTTKSPLDPTRGLVYIAAQPNACGATNVNDNTPFTYEAVYFVRDNSLWRRTILPATYANNGVLCSTPWQLPSCQPGYNPSTQSFCKSNDVELAKGVTSSGFFVQYFAGTGQQPISLPGTQAQLSTTRSVAVSIYATTTVAGRQLERAGTVRATPLSLLYQ